MRREARQLDQRRRPDQVEHRGSEDSLAACHRRQEDDGRSLGDRRVQALEGAGVLVVDVDVHERCDLAPVLEHLASKPGEANGQVAEHVAQSLAGGLDLAGASDLGAQSGWDPDAGHAITCVLPPWQNST